MLKIKEKSYLKDGAANGCAATKCRVGRPGIYLVDRNWEGRLRAAVKKLSEEMKCPMEC
jgi:hypothetical protein